MEEPKITAIRNGVAREFTRKMWDLMGTDKYGWELLEKAVPQTPKEVAGLTAAQAFKDVLAESPTPAPTPGTNKQSKRKKK